MAQTLELCARNHTLSHSRSDGRDGVEPGVKNRWCMVVKWLARLEVCRVGIGQARRLGDLDWSGTVSVRQAYELGSGRVPR